MKIVLCVMNRHLPLAGSVSDRSAGRMQSGRSSSLSYRTYAPVAASLGHSQAGPHWVGPRSCLPANGGHA